MGESNKATRRASGGRNLFPIMDQRNIGSTTHYAPHGRPFQPALLSRVVRMLDPLSTHLAYKALVLID